MLVVEEVGGELEAQMSYMHFNTGPDRLEILAIHDEYENETLSVQWK